MSSPVSFSINDTFDSDLTNTSSAKYTAKRDLIINQVCVCMYVWMYVCMYVCILTKAPVVKVRGDVYGEEGVVCTVRRV